MDDDEITGDDARFSPLRAAGTAATATTVGECNNEGSLQVLQPPGSDPSDETPDAPAADTGEAEAEEAGKVAGAQDLLVVDAAAAAAGDARGSAASDDQTLVSFAHDAEGGLAPALTCTIQDDGQESVQVNARARAVQIDKEFDAMLGERGYQEKRDTINFLADPTTRPVNPRLPVPSAEEKQSILRGGRSAKTWNSSYMMKIDYEGATRDLADERVRAREWNGSHRRPDREDWRSAPSSEWFELVPSMKRSPQQPVVRRAQHPVVLGGPKTGSGFVALRGPKDDSLERVRPEARPGYDGDELTSMVLRPDERDATTAHRPLPGASPAASPYSGTSTVRTVGGTPSRAAKPARVGGLAGSSLRDRRRSSGSVLRYRSSRRRPSLAGEQRHGAGTLGEFLGEGGDEASSTASGNGRREDSDGASLVQRGGATKRRAVGQDPQGPTSDAPAAGSKRAAASLGLGGMDATPRKKTMVETIAEEGENLVRRVEAEAKATAEVGSILMSVVSRENRSRDVSRQVREEQVLRAGKRDEQLRASSGQVRRVWPYILV